MRTGETIFAKRPLWAWPAALVVVACAAIPLVAYWLTNPADQRLVDLDVYRTGGQSLLLGVPLYDVITPAPQLLPFTYPPIAAMLAMPLAAVSWPVAQWVWTVAILATLAVTVWYAFRPALARVRVAMPLVFAVLVVACLYLMPIRDQVRFGQVDLFLVALCLLDCVVRRPWWPRGMLIGLATAVKLTPGVFLIYLAITAFAWRKPYMRDREQGRAFFMAVFTATLLTVLPFLVIPSDAKDFWFSALLDPGRLGANAATTNQSIRGMLIRLYLPDSVTSALWLVAVAAIGWYGFRCARRAYLDGDPMTAVALTGLMAVLLSPVAWIHHLAWVVIVLAALVGAGTDRVRLLVAGGVWLYYVVPVPWWGVSLKALEIPVLSPVLGKIVQNGFGLGAIALVWLLGSWLPRRRAVTEAAAAAGDVETGSRR
ncbi:glycosyltransferase 87 family protein [Microtetraspora sp. NBRC 16547]|uniref:glycosyltransferase 87 family protein n=1 Tax=Microtetraspora sp. NBRC 16547 TaxID=3030993 RepID=UPI0024A5265D|nr:glycosyltransferase 87 family protein [Microtetraspora sp. NBRC 16547]GLX02224.1 membrane protein [Microtetraspora sp. NBRC 16547]